MTTPTTKTCTKCGGQKDVDQEFGSSTQTKDGKYPWCRECCREKSKRDRERAKAARLRWIEKQDKGVYKLTCVPTGDVYFGCTDRLKQRESAHFYYIREKMHTNPTIRRLVQDNGYTEEDFRFEVIALVEDPEMRRAVEHGLIETTKCVNERS